MLSLSRSVSTVKIGFPQWFKLMRAQSGVSQRAIAEALGVSTQTVGNWEGGRSVPSLDPDQMLKLCSLLGVSLDALAKGFRGESELE